MTDRFLPTSLRRALERDIKEARRIAEEGAADAIRRLGVADPKAPAHLSDEDKAARRRLQAHARALGDSVADGVHTVDHLIEAAAYAQWHRRLFARFLAERGLLRHPDHGVAVTLEEAEELAAEEGFVDGWSAAESYAARMLPAVFQPEDPVLALTLAPEHAQALRKLVLGIDAETFQADDSLGWTYQFWRALEKDRVNKAGGKIGARELPAVTQLFTEPYMVKFLLHNTLGAWRAAKVLAERPELATGVLDEVGLRAAVAPPGYEFDMLRFVRESEDGPWRPAAGTFSGWPKTAAEIRALDPCCGSGHFLTEMLAILAALRVDEEGLSDTEAVAAVLSDNLFGLELDGRCVQIAAFAVALTAWRIGGFQPFGADQVHIAWVGAPPPLPRAEFEALGNGDVNLRRNLGALHEMFEAAPLLGSLIEPSRGDLADAHGALDFEPMLDRLLEKAKLADRANEVGAHEGATAARGMAHAASMLRDQYTLVATNVPFLGRSKQNAGLAGFLERRHFDSKADLATAMISRAINFITQKGTVAVVTPHNWLFASRYKHFRSAVLDSSPPALIAGLGGGAFSYGSLWDFPLALMVLSNEVRADVSAIDVSRSKTPSEKASDLPCSAVSKLPITAYNNNPDKLFVLEEAGTSSTVGDFAIVRGGITSGDSMLFRRAFWEVDTQNGQWQLEMTSFSAGSDYTGRDSALLWEGGKGQLNSRISGGGATIAGREVWGKQGIAISYMADLGFSLYRGEIFENTICVLVPEQKEHLPALWTFCQSGEFLKAVRKINKKLSIDVRYFQKAEFELDKWQRLALEQYPDGLPDAICHDPRQWLFHGHPAGAEKGTQLHVALARLAGYRWPAESDPEMRVSAESRDWTAKAAVLPSSDADGILALSAVGAERPLADRLREYMNSALPGWDEARMVRDADERIDKKIGKDLTLEGWLRDRAFRQHSALFHNRPFLWQVWDGQKDGFSAFLHYHRLDHAALQKLTYTLLGAWITRREAEKDERRVEAAKVLKQKLEAILEGGEPYDIFVRWKLLAQQPMGWNPDLDDGVRLNVRPWVTAGVLREAAPKGIKWGVDRGKDVASAPWFKLDKGERNNDRHTTLAEKQTARDAAAKAASA